MLEKYLLSQVFEENMRILSKGIPKKESNEQ